LLLRDGTVFELPEGDYLIGRRDQSNPDLVPEIDLTHWGGAAQGVSRQHARVTVSPAGVFIEDLGSSNRTLQNGYRLMKGQRYPLGNGDELRVGLVTLWVAIKPA
jgi:pSer/pThr/pTyr-binding forkhead associated (FHA) protein